MFDQIIPSAHAQFGGSTVSNAADAAAEGAQSGIQGLISYAASNIDNWIAGIVIVFIFYILARMSAGAMKRAILNKRDDIQESALILVERVTRLTVLIIGVTIAFAINGLNFTTVIGALSLGIGFALKDIIGNFISGVIMLSQNRINIGDFIKVGEILGTIVNIDTRATILQAIDGTEVVIPNQTMLGETLISYTTNPFRRIDLIVGVDYKTNLPMVTSLIKGIIDKDEAIVVKPEPLVLVDEFGDSSITIKIRFWVESSTNWQKVKSNLANRIKQAFDEVGVSIPFPIRTLKLDEDDRAFLKTMDSLKKGLVPNPAQTPPNEVVAEAAKKAGNSVGIPYNIFEEAEREGRRVTKEEMKPSAAQTQNVHKINPAPDHLHEDAKVPVSIPETDAIPPNPPSTTEQGVDLEPNTPPSSLYQKNTPKPGTPPPTHL